MGGDIFFAVFIDFRRDPSSASLTYSLFAGCFFIKASIFFNSQVKGYQVPPAELENVVKQHPAVFDAAVIGISDSYTGEKPKAFVVLKEGIKIDDTKIMDFVNQRVAPYKKINDISFIDAVPKNNSGKILRRVLKDMHEGK